MKTHIIIFLFALLIAAMAYFRFKKIKVFRNLFHKHAVDPDEIINLIKNLIDGLNHLSITLNQFNLNYCDQLQIYRREIEALHLEIGRNLKLIGTISSEIDAARGEQKITEFNYKKVLDRIRELATRYTNLEAQINSHLNSKNPHNE